jgi:hypothetical protein
VGGGGGGAPAQGGGMDEAVKEELRPVEIWRTSGAA